MSPQLHRNLTIGTVSSCVFPFRADYVVMAVMREVDQGERWDRRSKEERGGHGYGLLVGHIAFAAFAGPWEC